MQRKAAVVSVVGTALGLIAASPHPAFAERPLLLAQQAEATATAKAETPEERMNRRFPQNVRVGDLIGLPVLDSDRETLGHIEKAVRTPEGRILLIVSYSRWFGWFGRLVAVPIELVAIAGREVHSLDMPREAYEKAPTWSQGKDQPIPDDATIKIALSR